MWSRIKLIVILIIFETVLYEVKCKSKVPTKTTVLFTSTTEKPTVTHTHTYNIIQWETVNVTNENKEKGTTTKTTSEAATEVHNVTIRTWEPAETVSITEAASNFTSTRSYPKPECQNFKPSDIPFNLNRMADIWQTVYYQLPDKVQCFKIHIKKVSDEERIALENKYGSFDDKVNWGQVFLEIKALTNIARKHFLQGVNMDGGLLSNVIIVEENNNYLLHEESADQWLVYQKLLLMRDCESGGVVVFSKVPHIPLQQDIKDALKEFGEDYDDGRPACDEDEPVNRYYETEEEAIDNFK